MGETITVSVGAVAHGGHCVARHDGRVVFVRHALPGETVTAIITELGPKGRFARADTVEVVVPSDSRVPPPCRYAGKCGGCDWQHADLAYQRELKAAVVVEQLSRLGRVDVEVVVEPLPNHGTASVRLEDGLGWRTRVGYSVADNGQLGFKKHRSHDILPIDACVIAHPLVSAAAVDGRPWQSAGRVDVAASVATGEVVVRTGDEAWTTISEEAVGRQWQVTGGFWQVHPAAADTLVSVVLDQLAPQPGEHALDLYSGVGLFAGSLSPLVGPGGRIDAVEGSAQAIKDAGTNLADLANVWLHRADVRGFLDKSPLRRLDLVVLDPPRSGAGKGVIDRIVRLRPRAVAYVACDPAALARDVARLTELGYPLRQLRAFDLFPMTHHIECVALFEPNDG